MPRIHAAYLESLRLASNVGKSSYDSHRPSADAGSNQVSQQMPSGNGGQRSFESPISADGITIICAEPGMGRTQMLAGAVLAMSTQHLRVRFEDFSRMSAREAISAMQELMRWHERSDTSGQGAFIACDNVSVGDECDADNLAHVIRQLAKSGCAVALSMLPEGELLVEMLGEATVFWSCDLIASEAQTSCANDVWRAVGGIPLLLQAFERTAATSAETLMSEAAYQMAYVALVMAGLRSTLMREERLLRAVMLLLGHGSFTDARHVVGPVEPDTWYSLARDAPLFGVSMSDKTFCCVASDGLSGILASFDVICEAMQGSEDLALAAAHLLCEAGRFERAAICCALCETPGAASEIVFEWPAELINVGQLGLVRKTLEDLEEVGDGFSTGAVTARALVHAVEGKRADFEGGDGDGRAWTVPWNARSRHTVQMLLACDCQELLRKGAATNRPAHGGDSDGIAAGLAAHCHAVDLMLAGRGHEAYEYLTELAQNDAHQTVVSVLLSVDYFLCSCLTGVIPGPREVEHLERGRAFFAASGMDALSALCDAALTAGLALAGKTATGDGMDAHVHRASRLGFPLLRACFLVVSGAADLRTGAYTRSHVRLRSALKLFENMGQDYLASCARLLDACARLRTGNVVTKTDLEACKGQSTSLDGLVGICAQALSPVRSRRAPASAKWGDEAALRDVYWLVNVLSSDCGELSRNIFGLMPKQWCVAIAHDSSEADALCERLGQGGTGEVAAVVDAVDVAETCRKAEASSKHMRVSMLGKFEVSVGGITMGESCLERRRAKSLLALLAAVPGHSVKRFIIMESIWPEYDYDTAHKCVYSATSVLRSELGSRAPHDGAPKLVVSNKAAGTLGLNMDDVYCDVDELEQMAKLALDSNRDDAAVVRCCRVVEDLYKGDLVVPVNDGMGIVETRSKELRDLFVDTMIAGAHASSSLGRKIQACRFARKACDADTLREDALQVLMETLCAAGRQSEAERCYERYASKVVSITRRPPSKRMRELVERLLRNTAIGAKSGPASRGTDEVPLITVEPVHEQVRHEQMQIDFGEAC